MEGIEVASLDTVDACNGEAPNKDGLGSSKELWVEKNRSIWRLVDPLEMALHGQPVDNDVVTHERNRVFAARKLRRQEDDNILTMNRLVSLRFTDA